MKIAKRIVLFVTVNMLIIATVSTVMAVLGVRPYLEANNLRFGSLILFCIAWGFGGAFVSLAISRVMAKWMMGVKLIEPNTQDHRLLSVRNRVHHFARQAGLGVMPEVGYYESEELNAFATGPTRNRALVAVSTGLIHRMSEREVDGVLAHEVAHIANGDMVTMTLVQGVVNAFVMFLARVAAFFAGQLVAEERRPLVQFGVTIALEVVLGILGMLVVSFFSRAREFKADEGGATLSGSGNMIAALERLKLNMRLPQAEEQPALATLKISGHAGGFLRLFSTHPDLDDRIERLKRKAGLARGA